MPLTRIQEKVLQTLKPFRNKASFIGGGLALNKTWFRISEDADIYFDKTPLPEQVEKEIQTLRDKLFIVDVETTDAETIVAIVKEFGEETRIEWMNEGDIASMRFFEVIQDNDLGYIMHPADTAINKLIAASRRTTAARDIVDVINIANHYCPLGPLVWAITAKPQGMTPSDTIQNIRKIGKGYADEQLTTIDMTADAEPFTRKRVHSELDPLLDAALEYVNDVAPLDFHDLLFVDKEDVPVEATETDINSGRVRCLKIRKFIA